MLVCLVEACGQRGLVVGAGPRGRHRTAGGERRGGATAADVSKVRRQGLTHRHAATCTRTDGIICCKDVDPDLCDPDLCDPDLCDPDPRFYDDPNTCLQNDPDQSRSGSGEAYLKITTIFLKLTF